MDKIDRVVRIFGIIIAIVVIYVIIIPVGKHLYDNHTIKFKDENMEKLMTERFHKSEITPEDMAKLYELNIGYAGYYDTLEDLKWCKNVWSLKINLRYAQEEYELAYRVFKGEVPEEVSSERVEQYEKELGKVLPKLKNLKIY